MTPSASAFYFGPAERPLFGWLHVPDRDSVGDTGILICNPLGYDALCLHRTQRRIANSAVLRGIPALRFDYDGTGDSAGSDLDPHRLSSWVASVRLAALALRQRTGVSKVYGFGVRMGATLAMLASQGDRLIDGLIAVNPVADGRRYLRELRAMAVTSSQVMDDQLDLQDVLDFSGLVMTPQTREAVSAINLTDVSQHASLARVLLIDRSDLPMDDSLSRRLVSHGVAVERRLLAGYDEMLISAHESVVPEADIEQWLDWIPRSDAPCAVGATASAVDSCHFHWPDGQSETSLEERAAWLDPKCRTFGIITRLDRQTNQSDRGLLLLNSGTIHHVGPHRIYVRVARECARRGITVVRMDLPGIGDSPTLDGSVENATYPENPVDLIRPVVEYMRRELGLRAVDCVGICSGAYHALKVAAAGVDLREIAVVNPLTFFWKPHLPLSPPEFLDVANMQRYRRKGLNPHDWVRLLKGDVHVGQIAGVVLRRWLKGVSLVLREVARITGLPLKDDLAAELRDIASRGIRIHFVFSDRDPGGQMLRDEGGLIVNRLVRRGDLDIQTVPKADHTFTSWRNQQTIVERLVALTTGIRS